MNDDNDGKMKRLIEEFMEKVTTSDVAVLVVALPNELRFVCSAFTEPGPLDRLNTLVGQGGRPLGFVCVNGDLLEAFPLVEFENDPLALKSH